MTLFGLIPKDQKPKSKKLKGLADLGDIDFLAGGRQTVLNPTIHPETNAPYEAVGRDLAETPPEELPVFDMQQINVISALIACPEVLVLQEGRERTTPVWPSSRNSCGLRPRTSRFRASSRPCCRWGIKAIP